MASVKTKMITEYTLKNGKNFIVTRTVKEIIHPTIGAVISRDTTDLNVTGNSDKKLMKELEDWLKKKCSPPLPKLLKQYIEENTTQLP